MALSVWLHLSDPAAEPAATLAARLARALAQASVAIRPTPGRPDGYGVLLFSSADAALLSKLRHLSSSACVLALCYAPHALTPTAMWAVLAAGACDLLLCDESQSCADQVLARLQRWHAVEAQLASPAISGLLVGDNPCWRALLRGVVEVAAFTSSSVLITGETGTGKDLIAQAIHRLSGLAGELTVLDCSTLAPELAGSEFFGHERGAFTGAAQARDGAFALADGGLLFLDEVGELPLPMQAQLLRVIQEQKYKRLGSNTWQPSRFRLVCATNRELEAEVARGGFRADLYYRIAAWRCRTPPLRERRSDILALASHFLRQLADGRDYALDPAVRDYLLARDYPGNVRELRQTVARIWHRHCGPGPITLGDIPPDERPAAAPPWPDALFMAAIRQALDRGQSLGRIGQAAADVAIRLALEQEDGNNQRAALRLGVTDRALQLRRKAQADSAKASPDAPGAESSHPG
ncbi:sigma 54-interacting transcriptional regulator [Massilia sp. BJB1822]|uniref:sigma 54-interacting transcriptional regulator n=1 Tax=Massilia sp. BJB1822 TaxID=2744470 RepID=UPI0015940D51|nr:sigma 54-interacting transcriptional regulator [Massilia sp. BJB1822]NVD97615.1 sigma 54-interacting transcriptional regulator [Massilia sp. BJB1822]